MQSTCKCPSKWWVAKLGECRCICLSLLHIVNEIGFKYWKEILFYKLVSRWHGSIIKMTMLPWILTLTGASGAWSTLMLKAEGLLTGIVRIASQLIVIIDVSNKLQLNGEPENDSKILSTFSNYTEIKVRIIKLNKTIQYQYIIRTDNHLTLNRSLQMCNLKNNIRWLGKGGKGKLD